MVRAEAYGEWLGIARKRAGLTQRQLAEKLGVKTNTVSRWETGEQLPPAARRRTVERLLGPYSDPEIGAVAEESATYVAGSASMLIRVTPDELRVMNIYRWLVRQSEEGGP